jgi:hypothetical protein
LELLACPGVNIASELAVHVGDILWWVLPWTSPAQTNKGFKPLGRTGEEGRKEWQQYLRVRCTRKLCNQGSVDIKLTESTTSAFDFYFSKIQVPHLQIIGDNNSRSHSKDKIMYIFMCAKTFIKRNAN